jgi:hypothetical protein
LKESDEMFVRTIELVILYRGTNVISVLKTVRNLHNILQTKLISTTVGMIVCGKYLQKDISGPKLPLQNENLLDLIILMQKA